MTLSRFRLLTIAALLLPVCFASTASGALAVEAGVQDTVPLGSTRNSVVAIPMTGGTKELVYLTRGMSDEHLAEIAALAQRALSEFPHQAADDRRGALLSPAH